MVRRPHSQGAGKSRNANYSPRKILPAGIEVNAGIPRSKNGATAISKHRPKHSDTFGAQTRADLFGNLRHLLVQRKIELLDEPVLLRELRTLEERHTLNSNINIRPSHSQKDDVAVAAALAAFELTKRRPPREPWVEVISMPFCQSSLGGPLGGGLFRIS